MYQVRGLIFDTPGFIFTVRDNTQFWYVLQNVPPKHQGWQPRNHNAVGHTICVFFSYRTTLSTLHILTMFKRISGSPKVEWYAKDASVAFANGGLVYWNGSGEIIPADATSGQHCGVILRAVVSTDSDYATALAKVPVDVPTTEDVFEVDVETGTCTTAMVGNMYDLVADGDAIDVSATAKLVVTLVGFVSTSKALVKINSLATHLEIATS